jgi:hypothetical protein
MDLNVLKGFKTWIRIVRVTTNDFEGVERAFDLNTEHNGFEWFKWLWTQMKGFEKVYMTMNEFEEL